MQSHYQRVKSWFKDQKQIVHAKQLMGSDNRYREYAPLSNIATNDMNRPYSIVKYYYKRAVLSNLFGRRLWIVSISYFEEPLFR